MATKEQEAFLRSLEEEKSEDARAKAARFARFIRRAAVVAPSGGLTVRVTLAAGQNNPVSAGPVNFTVTFSKPATGFTNADISFTGSTVGGTLAAVVTGTGPYNVAVTGMSGAGLVRVSVPAGSATDATGAPFPVSNSAAVSFDVLGSATLVKAAGQTDPTDAGPINFTATFAITPSVFTSSDIDLSASSAPGTLTAVVTGSNPYNVAVSGMTNDGTVVASIKARSGGTVPVNPALVKSATGAAATASVTPAFASPTTAGNIILLAISGDAGVPTPGTGWTQPPNMAQVGNNGGYLWVRVSTGETTFPAYTLSVAANSTWVLTEFSGLTISPIDGSLGQHAEGSRASYTTPALVPTAGDRVLFAAMLASSDVNLTLPFTNWLNSFTFIAGIGQSTGQRTCAGLAYRRVTGDGVASFSSGVTWPNTATGSVGLILGLRSAGSIAVDPLPGSTPAIVNFASTFPNAATTGVQDGIVLTPYTGPVTVTTPGTLIENKLIDGGIEITAANCIIRNCRIINSSIHGISADTATNITIDHCDIVGPGSSTVSTGILAGGTITNNDVSGYALGMSLTAAGTVKDNYVHDLHKDGVDVHYDGIAIFGGGAALIEHNTFWVPTQAGGGATACIFLKNFFGQVDGLTIRNNLCRGEPAYTFQLDGQTAGSTISNVSIVNNVMETGIFGYFSVDVPPAATNITGSGNVDYLTGAVVPFPNVP